jgi:hypothetical protein
MTKQVDTLGNFTDWLQAKFKASPKAKPDVEEEGEQEDKNETPKDEADEEDAEGKKVAKKQLGGHLVTDEKGEKHLPTTVDGAPDAHHMGMAWAALHGGLMGNKYKGPDADKAISKLKGMYEAHNLTPPNSSASKEFTTDFSIFKQADETYRWMGVTSSGFRDRDHQLVTSDALKQDVARMNKEANFGETSFWHVMLKEENPQTLDPGVALDIANCDVSEMMGDVSNLESGVFYDNAVGKAFNDKQDQFGFSREFFYPASEPDAQGNYNKIHTFRRTILPKQHASNLMSAGTLSIAKETKEGKMATFEQIVGAAKRKEVEDMIKAKEKALSSSGVEKKEATGLTEARVKEIVGEALTSAFKEFVAEFAKAQGELMASAKKEKDDFAVEWAAMKEVVTELHGDAPNMIKGFKASEAVQTILKGGDDNEKVKATKKNVDAKAALNAEPMGAMINWLAVPQNGNGQ